MLLSAHLAKPEIVDVLAEDVEMHSRIEMLKALNVTTAQERKMMRSLGKLRNRLVHNVTRTNFTFVDHLSDKNLRQDFAETYCLNWPDKIQIGGRPRPRSEFVLAQPRLAMWMSVVAFAMKTGKAQMQAQMDEKRRQMLEALRIAWEAAGDEPEEADESSEEQ
jgi:hypothetical protein